MKIFSSVYYMYFAFWNTTELMRWYQHNVELLFRLILLISWYSCRAYCFTNYLLKWCVPYIPFLITQPTSVVSPIGYLKKSLPNVKHRSKPSLWWSRKLWFAMFYHASGYTMFIFNARECSTWARSLIIPMNTLIK